jgi:hypothetical protein
VRGQLLDRIIDGARSVVPKWRQPKHAR